MALQAFPGTFCGSVAPGGLRKRETRQYVSLPVLLSSGENCSVGMQTFFGSTNALKLSFSPTKPSEVNRNSGIITAVIKRRKDYPLDNVIQREKKLKLAMRIKELLVRQPGQVMSLKDLGKNRKYIGLTGKRRCIALLNKFPGIFQVYEEGVNTKLFRFTKEAKMHYLEEMRQREEMEEILVVKLRKLLMMSIDRRILMEKIGHIRRELGLPDDFKTNLVQRYPQYMQVVETEAGSALELTSWDPSLAVTALEKAAQEKAEARKQLEEEVAKSLGDDPEVITRAPRFSKKIDLPKGLQVKRKDKEKLIKFQELPYISPYSDASHLNPASPEAEKYVVSVIHELLSLCLEKKLLVDHLTHFRRDYQFSQRVRALLIRHPEVFYVSLKGVRDSVFLREAYNGSELKEKDPLVLLKERMAELVAQSKKTETMVDNSDYDDDDDDEDDNDDDWDEDEGDVGSVSDKNGRVRRMAEADVSQPNSRRELLATRERW